MSGEYEQAISLAFGILETLEEDDELKYQTLVDLASFLSDYGLPTVASAALRVVQKAAPERHVRRHATLNLFFLAAHHENAAAFEVLRAQLASERLTPRQQAQFALFTAQGCRRFARFAEARSAAQRAIELANRYEHFQLVFEAETELSDIMRAMENASSEIPQRPERSRSNIVAVSDDVMPNPSATSIGWDSVPAEIREVAESLDFMAAQHGVGTSTAMSTAMSTVMSGAR